MFIITARGRVLDTPLCLRHIQDTVYDHRKQRTLKKSWVDPSSRVPYLISVCLTRSSAESIGVSMRSMVRKAARLAVYDEMMMSVKNHHALPIIRPANDLQTQQQQQPPSIFTATPQHACHAQASCKSKEMQWLYDYYWNPRWRVHHDSVFIRLSFDGRSTVIRQI